MSTYTPNDQKYSQNTTSSGTVRNSADDALEDRAYQLLLESTYQLKEPYDLESRFTVLVLGRLGLRVGEMIHMEESWIDWRQRMIRIPYHEPCHKGQDGGPCGYCRQLARQREENNDDVSFEDALGERWSAKTEAAARSVPFDFDPRVEIVVERYFDECDAVHISKSAVNRRINKCAELVPEVQDLNIYPHCLRATAASYHASRGLDAISLQSLLGWADLSTAHRYVRRSGDRTRRALNATHSR